MPLFLRGSLVLLVFPLAACQWDGDHRHSLRLLEPRLPDTPVNNVVEDFHGTTVTDPYGWLESVSGQQAAWLEAQSTAGRRWLDRLPQRERVSDVLEAFHSMAGMQLVGEYGEHVYFFHDPGGRNQSDLYRIRSTVLLQWACPAGGSCEGLVERAQPVLNASEWGAGRVMRSVAVSPDGRKVAWSEQREADAPPRWLWKEVGAVSGQQFMRTGVPVADLLWDERSHGWYAVQSGEQGEQLVHLAPDRSIGRRVCPLPTDKVIERLQRVGGSPGTLLLRVAGADGVQLQLCDAGAGPVVRLDDGTLVEPRYLGSRDGSHYFLHDRTDWRGEVIALRVSADDRVSRETVVAPSDHRLVDAVLTGQGETTAVWLHYRRQGRSVLALHDGSMAGAAREITWPGDTGAVRVESLLMITGSAAAGEDGVLYVTYSDPVTPPGIVRLRRGSPSAPVWSPQRPVMLETLSVQHRDVDTGAPWPVPLYLAGDLDRVDDNREVPLVLEAYGGFDMAVELRFSPSRAAWMALGGRYAVAGVRGGGDRNQEWHLAGRVAGKLDSIRDVESVMGWLVEEGVAGRGLIALRGYSQGATLMAAVAARGIQPAGALLVSAGVMDLLRYPTHEVGRTWIPEYGDPASMAGFEAVWQYSPYHLLLRNPPARHPVTLVTTRDRDAVVAPWHSYKYLAALQRSGVPAVLRLEEGASHAASAAPEVLRRRQVDQWALLLAVLGH